MHDAAAKPAPNRHVAVIGAGIIGVCAAVQLLRQGNRVTLIDSVEPGRGTSFGNAGGIAVGSIVPLSLPGTLRQVPGWLMDPLGPLAIRWRYLPKLAPWLWRFWRAGSQAQVERAAAALAGLLAPTYDDYMPLLRDAGLVDLLRRDGCLTLYETRAAYEAELYSWDLKRAHGVGLEIVGRDELRQMEPDIAPNYELAVYQPDWGRVLDPYKIVAGLARWFAGNGGTIAQARVTGAAIGEAGATALTTDAGSIAMDAVVVAAGARSHEIARWLGSRVPLETERGYHLTLPNPGPSPRRTISMGGWVMTPMEMGLRLAGTVELAGLEAPPDWRRARILAERAKIVLPGLNSEGGTEWMGHRPSLPDSLPVISGSPHHANVFYAFGASHLGLTEGATTGRLIADLVAGRTSSIDLAPFRVDRF
ncbi:MAG: FAD-binding oxidoreductase [Proteobacteria bacterium]|nr:FAD-binding oxidoreductase [Pseudomonadota bacterium]MBI3500056.1 FAD-binding oxidoreductase [Pseudomonadota bacterium]